MLMVAVFCHVGRLRAFIITTQVKTTIVPYVQALMDGMPPKCKLPRYEYGTKGLSIRLCV